MKFKLFPAWEAAYKTPYGIRRELFRMVPFIPLVMLRARALEGGRTYSCTLIGVKAA